MDKNKSHFLSPEDTEEIRRLEQELAFLRGSASKRLAGWTRDGSVEEIAGWMMEAQRLNKEVEAKKRGNQGKMPEWGTVPWTVWMVLCRHEGAYTNIAINIRV